MSAIFNSKSLEQTLDLARPFRGIFLNIVAFIFIFPLFYWLASTELSSEKKDVSSILLFLFLAAVSGFIVAQFSKSFAGWVYKVKPFIVWILGLPLFLVTSSTFIFDLFSFLNLTYSWGIFQRGFIKDLINQCELCASALNESWYEHLEEAIVLSLLALATGITFNIVRFGFLEFWSKFLLKRRFSAYLVPIIFFAVSLLLLNQVSQGFRLWTLPNLFFEVNLPLKFSTFLLLASLIFLIVSIVYHNSLYFRAGRANFIPRRIFNSLDWSDNTLIHRLLSDGEDGYAAYLARLSNVQKESPLSHLAFLKLNKRSQFDFETLLNPLDELALPIDDVDGFRILRELQEDDLIEEFGDNEHFRFKAPEFAEIFTKANQLNGHSNSFSEARQDTHVYKTAIDFLIFSGFKVMVEQGNNLFLTPDEESYDNVLGSKVVALLSGKSNAKVNDLQELANLSREANSEASLEGQVAFLFCTRALGEGAKAQSLAYQYDESFFILPFDLRNLDQINEPKLFAQHIQNFVDPGRVKIQKFFNATGFDSAGEAGDSFILKAKDKKLDSRLGGEVFLKFFHRAVKGSEITSLFEQAKQSFEDGLENKVALLVSNKPIEATARATMFAYRFDQKFIIVPFQLSQIEESIERGEELLMLDQVLNESLNLEQDLFNKRHPVMDDNFYGRSRELESLKRFINQKQPVGIFALNKMGKTSIIRNLSEQLPGAAVAMVDLQVLSNKASAVFETIISGLKRDIRSKWPDLDISTISNIHETKVDDYGAAFVKDIQLLHELVKHQIENPQFVIFIDEIDQLIPNIYSEKTKGFENYPDIIGRLRGVSQIGLPLSLIVVGINPTINRTARLEGQENPGFEIFHEYFLEPMSKEDCLQMIEDIGMLMGINFTKVALDRLFIECGGHPHLTRQLCSVAWGHLKEKNRQSLSNIIDLDILEAAIDEFLEKQGFNYFEQIWSTRINDTQRLYLRSLVDDSKSNTTADISTKEVNSLVERHIIKKENDEYKIMFYSFEKWIENET